MFNIENIVVIDFLKMNKQKLKATKHLKSYILKL